MRITAGHKHLLSTKGYKVSTLKPGRIFKYLIHDMRWTFKEVLYTGILIFLEGISRIVGTLNFYFRDKNPYVWDISFTTKNVDMT
jgi:hypothetical protein